MPSMTFTVSPELAQRIALAVGQKIRGMPKPGQPWTPPDPATMQQVRKEISGYIEAMVIDYEIMASKLMVQNPAPVEIEDS